MHMCVFVSRVSVSVFCVCVCLHVVVANGAVAVTTMTTVARQESGNANWANREQLQQQHQ